MPAAFANTAPVIANNIPYINRFNMPMDFGKTFRGQRIFGDHKTFRGLAAGISAGLVCALAELLLFNTYDWPHTVVAGRIDYSQASILLMGAAMGAGALLGDAVKSFFKRQMGVKPGDAWVPFDQIDFILGGLLLSIPFARLPLTTYLAIAIIMTLLHPVINVLGWLLHLKSKPF